MYVCSYNIIFICVSRQIQTRRHSCLMCIPHGIHHPKRTVHEYARHFVGVGGVGTVVRVPMRNTTTVFVCVCVREAVRKY